MAVHYLGDVERKLIADVIYAYRLQYLANTGGEMFDRLVYMALLDDTSTAPIVRLITTYNGGTLAQPDNEVWQMKLPGDAILQWKFVDSALYMWAVGHNPDAEESEEVKLANTIIKAKNIPTL